MASFATPTLVEASRGSAAAQGVRGEDLPSAHFRAFYDALVEAREVALACSEAEAAATAQLLSKRLIQIIELHTLEMRRLGGRAVMDTEVQARYLKAALADELMLNTDWVGRHAWRHVLLEAQLFRSSVAGDKIFDDIDLLLRVREPAQRAVARLYLHALALGFQGRWRGGGDMHRLAQYRRELFEFVAQREPALGGVDRPLSPQAYSSTLGHLARRRIPRLSRWSLVVILIALFLLGVSEMLWLWRSWPVRDVLNQVVAHAGPSSNLPLATRDTAIDRPFAQLDSNQC